MSQPMSNKQPNSEFDRWLTFDRIAHSMFMELVFDGLHDGSWERDAAMELAMSALRGFANGNCYFLASAVARATGWPILGFLRPGGTDDLVHAAIFDPSSGDAFDILGRRPIGEVRIELVAAVGALRLSILPSLQDIIEPEELECLSLIASGLPWMPIRRPPIDRKEWQRLLQGYVAGRANR